MEDGIRIGLVGLDTSHCLAFTRILLDKESEYYLPGAQIVGAYPGGSQWFALSRERVKDFTNALETRYTIPMVTDIAELADQVDALMLLSGDGRQHPEQFRKMAAGKPVFIDKPLAVSTLEAGAIFSLARKTGTPIFSCSSLRYAAGITGAADLHGRLLSCEVYGPAQIFPDYPGLFWYGVHSVDMLFSFMGTGCRRVRCLSYPEMELIVGEWQDGRLGLVRGTRFERNEFGCLLHTSEGIFCHKALDTPPYYYLLMEKILAFFRTGISPVSPEEAFEVIAFIDAAHQSAAENGRAIETAAVEPSMLQS